MEHRQLTTFGVLVFVVGVIGSVQMLDGVHFPKTSSGSEESQFQRVKREGMQVELSRVKRMPSTRLEHASPPNTREELARVKRVDLEQLNRVKRNIAHMMGYPMGGQLDDERFGYHINRMHTITGDDESLPPKVNENRKRVNQRIEDHPDPNGMRDMTSFIRGINLINQAAPPKTSIVDRMRKFISKGIEITEKEPNWPNTRENRAPTDPMIEEHSNPMRMRELTPLDLMAGATGINKRKDL